MGVFRGFSGALGALGVGLGAAEFLGFLRNSVAEAREAERATLKLQAVLKATGGAAGLTAQELRRLADEMQAATGIENDLVIDAEAVLATFKSIGRDAFPEALQAAADLSAVFGQDLKASTVQLGKALEDPVRGLTALRRVGVSFTAAQEAQVKALVAANRQLDAQRLILGEVESQVGGAAAAMQGPLSRGLSEAGLAWKNFKEEVGNSLPITGALEAITAAFEGLTDAVRAYGRYARGEVLNAFPTAPAPYRWGAVTPWADLGKPAPAAPRSSAPAAARGGAPATAPRAGARPALSSPFYSALPGQWGGTDWEGQRGAAELAARLNAAAAVARTAGYSVGYSADAVVAYWDAQAAAVDASEQAAQAASAAGLERYSWQTRGEQERAATGRTGAALAAGVLGGMEAGAGGWEGYNAGAVIDYWDRMAAGADAALDADKVKQYTAAFQGLGEVIGGTSTLLYQMYQMSEGENKKLFRWYQGMAAAETVIATSQAIMNAYAQAGPYLGTGLAVALGALGAAKVGLIMSQSPPELAEGGIVTRRTLAVVGEAGPEAVIPLSRGLPALGGDTNVVVNIPVQGSLDPRLLPVVEATAYEAVRRGLAEAARDNPQFRAQVRRLASGRA
jgi:hypothetical protein